jgi:transposase
LFREFLECLDLPTRTVIILDNVKFHSSKVVTAYAAQRGWELLYIPPYCPWFNPIELCFSIVKRAYYRDMTPEEAWGCLTAQHCEAFFRKSLTHTQALPDAT